MSIKIFFDMDGVLVNFAEGAAKVLNDALQSGDTTHRNLRRLLDYEGPREVITGDYLNNLVTRKDAGMERTKWEKLVNYAMFTLIGRGGQSHWENLSPLVGHTQMIEAAIDLIGLNKVYVCTAPIHDKDGGCERGKRSWVQANTVILPSNVFVTEDKGSIAAQFPDDTCVLIDDRTKYCTAWESSGGIAIRHPLPASMESVYRTISQIQLIVKSH